MDKKLYLSETDKKITGVCGGLGEYFNVDSTIGLAWIFLLIPTAFWWTYSIFLAAVVILRDHRRIR